MNALFAEMVLTEEIKKRILTPNVDDAELDDGSRLDQVRDNLRRTGQRVTDAAIDQFNR